MLQDEINICGSIQHLRVKCYACKKMGHFMNDCKMLHFCADREKIIKEFEFSHPREQRSPFARKRQKGHYQISKSVKMPKELLSGITFDFDPNFEEYDSSNEATEQKNTKEEIPKMFHKEKDEAKELKEVFSKTFTSPTENAFLEIPSQREKFISKPQISLVCDDPQNFPINNETIHMKRSSNTQFSIKIEESKNVDSHIMKNSLIKYQNPMVDIEDKYFSNLDSFDIIHNFKNYFSDQNFSVVKRSYKKHSHFIKWTQKKQKALKKCSMYTFQGEDMYQIINQKRNHQSKIAKTETKAVSIEQNLVFRTKNKDLSCGDRSDKSQRAILSDMEKIYRPNKKFSFTDLAFMIIEKQKKKKEKQNYYNSFKKFCATLKTILNGYNKY